MRIRRKAPPRCRYIDDKHSYNLVFEIINIKNWYNQLHFFIAII